MAQDFHDLVVWQRAIELTICIYQLTRSFPKDEVYGLVSQMRRASVSVASNLAEGRGRLGPAEFRQFLGLAHGSTCEIRTQLVTARRLAMGDASALGQAESLAEEISKMLTSFIQTIREGSAQEMRKNKGQKP
jgi:four helix bundle protein